MPAEAETSDVPGFVPGLASHHCFGSRSRFEYARGIPPDEPVRRGTVFPRHGGRGVPQDALQGSVVPARLSEAGRELGTQRGREVFDVRFATFPEKSASKPCLLDVCSGTRIPSSRRKPGGEILAPKAPSSSRSW